LNRDFIPEKPSEAWISDITYIHTKGSRLGAIKEGMSTQETSLAAWNMVTKNRAILIAGWEETYKDGFGDQAKVFVSRGILDKRIKLNYWNHHDKKDLPYRKELGL